MKEIKIILTVVVIVIIGFFIWKWVAKSTKIGIIKPPTNQFTARIESEIDSLSKITVNEFCKKLVSVIQYDIDDKYKQGLLSENNPNDNNQWKEILSKNLYSAYVPKFIDQTMYVFNRSEWKVEDINFIRSEVQTLQSSTYLDQSSPVASAFNTINAILSKYDEISQFISGCADTSYSNTSIDSTYPDKRESINKAKDYLSNNLDNSYVNNCNRLRDGLRDVPRQLFLNHVNYLKAKMTINSTAYKSYNTQPDYSNTMYAPLKSQIDSLANNIYGIDDNLLSTENSSLEKQLSDINSEATSYFLSK